MAICSPSSATHPSKQETQRPGASDCVRTPRAVTRCLCCSDTLRGFTGTSKAQWRSRTGMAHRQLLHKQERQKKIGWNQTRRQTCNYCWAIPAAETWTEKGHWNPNVMLYSVVFYHNSQKLFTDTEVQFESSINVAWKISVWKILQTSAHHTEDSQWDLQRRSIWKVKGPLPNPSFRQNENAFSRMNGFQPKRIGTTHQFTGMFKFDFSWISAPADARKKEMQKRFLSSELSDHMPGSKTEQSKVMSCFSKTQGSEKAIYSWDSSPLEVSVISSITHETLLSPGCYWPWATIQTPLQTRSCTSTMSHLQGSRLCVRTWASVLMATHWRLPAIVRPCSARQHTALPHTQQGSGRSNSHRQVPSHVYCWGLGCLRLDLVH